MRPEAVPACLLAVLYLACRVHAAPVLNEVLFDPQGADTGFEFVELVSLDSTELSLEGVVLEFCNGSGNSDWVRLWEGGPNDFVPPDRPFLLGEEGVSPTPDRIVSLALQNGPDALRLLKGGEVLDLLGYGEGLPDSLREGLAATDVSSGRCLARRPDGIDTNQNLLDWVSAQPSPAAWNYPVCAAELLKAAQSFAPTGPGLPRGVRVQVVNSGLAPWPGPARLLGGSMLLAEIDKLEAGHEAVIDLICQPPQAGDFELELVLELPACGLSDALLLPARSGVGPVIISEIQFAPTPDGCEWVECLTLQPLSAIASLRMEDLSGAGDSFLPPVTQTGERFILAADRALFLSKHPGLPAAKVLELSSWPSLANSGQAPADPGWTDGLRLIDEEGRPVDGMLYRGDWIEGRGQTLERLSLYASGTQGCWAVCPTGSSPLTGPDPRPFASLPPAPEVTVRPNPFDPALGAVEFTAGTEGGPAQLLIFDAPGALMQVIDGNGASGPLRLFWDGRDRSGRSLPDGAYPFLLRLEQGGRRESKGVCAIVRGRH